MVTVQITDRTGDRPISLCYLDDNEKYTFNNGSIRTRAKNVTGKQTLIVQK